MHVHIESESNPKAYEERFRQNPADVAFNAAVYAERTLMAGFTTVRDLGGSGRQRFDPQRDQRRQGARSADLHRREEHRDHGRARRPDQRRARRSDGRSGSEGRRGQLPDGGPQGRAAALQEWRGLHQDHLDGRGAERRQGRLGTAVLRGRTRGHRRGRQGLRLHDSRARARQGGDAARRAGPGSRRSSTAATPTTR